MPQVTVNSQGNVILQDTFLRHMYIAPSGEYWFDERCGNLVFHAHRSSIAFVYSILSATNG